MVMVVVDSWFPGGFYIPESCKAEGLERGEQSVDEKREGGIQNVGFF